MRQQSAINNLLKIFGGEIVIPVKKGGKITYMPIKKTRKQIKREIDQLTPSLFDT